ncbi:type II toxin-antitoxin system prevent-host-death family antitoxin [Rhizobium sp. P40RR-XXII]|uniref:type II toxin-antitoxin system Phd/YefM family antitoxin n=1 Tax=Rhizobium sp. P40RR-XXII TaxID=2726739 RepID=UPI0014574F35|nr:type II toxin-antitoxin system prevent-host-death family antitoxin [Rhizobium sp. P40RR-XXII]NLS17532.1 type II toxin-antitoxin system prevent-host-death family antitoxin [Rhizobium sp. P40RR-XXII]
MPTICLKDARASFSRVVDQAAAGEFVTITRRGRAVAVVVSVKAAEEARKAAREDSLSLLQYLKTFPTDIDPAADIFSRDPASSREVDL